jgi:hypothetical protein
MRRDATGRRLAVRLRANRWEALSDRVVRLIPGGVQRARAATALLWTLNGDARTAADNALYEAIGASGEDPMWIEDAALAAARF